MVLYEQLEKLVKLKAERILELEGELLEIEKNGNAHQGREALLTEEMVGAGQPSCLRVFRTICLSSKERDNKPKFWRKKLKRWTLNAFWHLLTETM